MKGSIIFSFIIGATSGAAISWFLTKQKYEALNKEDEESFKEGLKRLNKKIKELEKEVSAQKPKEDPVDIKKRNDELVESVIESAKAIQEKHKYRNYSDVEDGNGTDKNGKPIVSDEVKKKIDIEKITEEVFNEPDSKFEKCGITLYMDAVFTDDADKEMSDGYLSETIGIDIRDELLESKDVGTVYVRNHKTGRDYEILCLDETWNDAHDVE